MWLIQYVFQKKIRSKLQATSFFGSHLKLYKFKKRKHTIAILMKIMGEDKNPILIFDNKILQSGKLKMQWNKILL